MPNNHQHHAADLYKLVFLTGMPAAGKTFWGDKIARACGFQFIDLDVFVAGHEKASIPALFATYGEHGFREREHKYLKEIVKGIDKQTIVACGGGTPCFGDNMQLMKDAGTVIYLQADIPTLINNIETSEEVRPMLKGRSDVPAYLESLLKKRKSFYEQAHYILTTENFSLSTFAEIIPKCTNRQ
jgi:shikimate kinase